MSKKGWHLTLYLKNNQLYKFKKNAIGVLHDNPNSNIRIQSNF